MRVARAEQAEQRGEEGDEGEDGEEPEGHDDNRADRRNAERHAIVDGCDSEGALAGIRVTPARRQRGQFVRRCKRSLSVGKIADARMVEPA